MLNFEKPTNAEEPTEERPNKLPEMINVNSIDEFRKVLKKWHQSPDGEQFCPDCWGKYLNRIKPEDREGVKNDSDSLNKRLENCKYRDGYLAMCEECGKAISCDLEEKKDE